MASTKWRIVALDGMEEREISCDTVKVIHPDGWYVELHPRRSDGRIILYAQRQLVIRPEASNCADVTSEGRP